MSVIFFGTPEFAVPSLKALLASGEDISLVVTQPDRAKGRGHNLSSPPVMVISREAALSVAQPERLRDEALVRQLAGLKPEFIIVVAYGRILPEAILHLPMLGCINVHASLLPKYRGAAPMAWAIVNGERKTGVTTMLMEEGLDTGDILLQEEEEIHDDDTTGSLGRRLSELGASLLISTVKGMRNGSVIPIPQAGEASYAPPLKKEDGRINWAKSAGDLFNMVRGMQPWPGAYCDIGSERVTFLRTREVSGQGEPGVISLVSKDAFFVGTGKGLLAVMELQPAGKKPMSAAAFIQGRRLRQGMPLR